MLYLHKPLYVRRWFKLGSLKLKNNNSSLSSYNMERMNFVWLNKINCFETSAHL